MNDFKSIFFFIFFISICFSLEAQSRSSDNRKRLEEVRAEKEKINSYIKSGNSSGELTELLSSLEEEERELLKKVKRSKKSKKKKREKKKLRASKRKSEKGPGYNVEERGDSKVIPQVVVKVVEEKNTKLSRALSANFMAVSDYIWRGQTQTDNGLAIQGGVNLDLPYCIDLGVWASNISGGTEVDMVAGFSFELAKSLSISLGHTFYHYTKDGSLDTSEYFVGFDVDGHNFSANYTPDYLGSKSTSWYFNYGKSFEVSKKNALSLALNIGYSKFAKEDLVGSKNYMDYGLTMTKSLKGFDVGISYSDTNRKSFDGVNAFLVKDHSYRVNFGKEF